MYNYKEAVKADVREWMEENREQWEDLDRADAEQVIYDGTWADDSVTGNASGSYTMSRYEARRNFFEDEETDDYISEMLDDGFITFKDLEHIKSSDWEWFDVVIRCWLLSGCVSEAVSEVYDD